MAGPSRRRGVCGRGFAILKYLRYGVKSQRYPILTCPLYPHAWIRLENLNLKNGIRHPSSRPWPIGCWLKACRWRWRARTSTGFWSTNCWSHMASRSCSSTPGNFTIPGSNLESGTTCGGRSAGARPKWSSDSIVDPDTTGGHSPCSTAAKTILPESGPIDSRELGYPRRSIHENTKCRGPGRKREEPSGPYTAYRGLCRRCRKQSSKAPRGISAAPG